MTRPLANLDASRGDYDAVETALRGSPRGRAFLAELEHRLRNGCSPPVPMTSSIPPAEAAELRRIGCGLQGVVAEVAAALEREPFLTRMSAVAEEAQDIAWTFREREGDPTLWARLDGLAAELVASAASPHGREIAGSIGSLRTLISAFLRLTEGAPHPNEPEPAAPAEIESAPVAAGPPPAAAIRAEAEREVDVRKLHAVDALLLFS